MLVPLVSVEIDVLYHPLVFSKVIFESFEQPLNAYSPTEVTPLPMVTLVRREQSENAYLPIEVTLLGIVMLVRLEQL